MVCRRVLRWVSAGWLSAIVSLALFSPGTQNAQVVLRPKAAPGPLDNPLKGWCPYPDAGPIYQPYSMVFQYVPWKTLEPEEGAYRFDAWEQREWEAPVTRGRHIVLRVWIDYPGQPSGLPDWLVRQGIRLRPYREYGGGLSPDYDDPRMVAAMVRFIEALGRRYNNNPRVAFVQLGLLGHWGEWHTYPHTELFASERTQRAVLAAYRRAFPDKHLMARYARGPVAEVPWIGFHDDMFPEDTENGKDWSFLATLRRTGRINNWRVAPFGGEMVPGQARYWLGPGYQTTLQMIRTGHFSWLGPYCPALEKPPDEQFTQRCAEMVRTMGYQFRLTEVCYRSSLTRGEVMQLTIRGVNEGVAPFYYAWPVRLALMDSNDRIAQQWTANADIRKWLPGGFVCRIDICPDVVPGSYRLVLGIIDPWTTRPAVRFANLLPVARNWTVLGEVRIKPPESAAGD